jgi:hypothetical protein
VKGNESYGQELRERAARQSRLDEIVKDAMARVIAQISGRQPAVHSHFFYGASAIHPRHLVTWYLFRTDSEWNAAKHGGLTSEIEHATRAELLAGGYPQEGIQPMHVAFTSDEDIQRVTGGDYWAYFK